MLRAALALLSVGLVACAEEDGVGAGAPERAGPAGPPLAHQPELGVQPVFQGEGAPMMDPHRCPPEGAQQAERAESWVREHLFGSPPVEQGDYQQRLDEVFLQMSQALERGDLCAYHALSGPAEVYAFRCNHAHQDQVAENFTEWQRWWAEQREVPLRDAWLEALLDPRRVCDDTWKAHVLSVLPAAGCALPAEVHDRVREALAGSRRLDPGRRQALERWSRDHTARCAGAAPAGGGE
jgi:hypothetical protein